MVMTEVEELDLKEDPCEKDEEYNFQVKAYIRIGNSFLQACVSESITRILECNLGWEEKSDKQLPPCNTAAQLE